MAIEIDRLCTTTGTMPDPPGQESGVSEDLLYVFKKEDYEKEHTSQIRALGSLG